MCVCARARCVCIVFCVIHQNKCHHRAFLNTSSDSEESGPQQPGWGTAPSCLEPKLPAYKPGYPESGPGHSSRHSQEK
jgi:hypothetical protein